MAKQEAKPPKKKTREPPPVDKLIKPAIGIGLALLAYQFMKGLSSEVSSTGTFNALDPHHEALPHISFQINRVNVLDELELREVFFGEGGTGKSYAVLCHEEDSTLPVSSVFQEAFADGSSPAEFRLIDCNHVLSSSEKSIAERFKLDLKTRPTIFLSGTVHPPQQIPSKHLKTGAMLIKLLKGKLELRAAKVETTQDLRSKCLDKDICALLLKGAKQSPGYLKDAMSKLLKEFPKVAFASVDSTVLYVLNLEEFIPELTSAQPRFVVFQKVSGSLESGGDRLITSYVSLPTSVAYGPMSNLVAGVVRGTETMTKLSALPVIKTRTKKLEEQERAKRERRHEQKQREFDKSSQTGGSTGGFQANDGSREGRRAERDRRRADHRATHNVKERTPEELAEIERQRRIRMADETAKWNVAPDDAPPEGAPVMDDGEEDLFDESEYVTEEAGSSSGDDEDVMDLD